MKSTLIGFDGHTTYWVYIEKQSCVIWAKNLQIFEDIKIQKDTILPYYEDKPTFQSFFLDDNDDKEKTFNKALNKMPSSVIKDLSKLKTIE